MLDGRHVIGEIEGHNVGSISIQASHSTIQSIGMTVWRSRVWRESHQRWMATKGMGDGRLDFLREGERVRLVCRPGLRGHPSSCWEEIGTWGERDRGRAFATSNFMPQCHPCNYLLHHTTFVSGLPSSGKHLREWEDRGETMDPLWLQEQEIIGLLCSRPDLSDKLSLLRRRQSRPCPLTLVLPC